jgi:mRNA-decapping enzyme 1A
MGAAGLYVQCKMTIVPLQAAGPALITAATTAVSAVLLSPSVFQQSVPRPTDPERRASSPSPLTAGTPENQRKPSIILSKSQLQDTLIHLIKVSGMSI